MRSLVHRPLSRLLLGTLVAFLAGSWFAPSRACAECGDYVIMGSHWGKDSGHLWRQPDSPPTGGHEHPAGQHTPCSGPHCSRPAVPLDPVPAAPAPLKRAGQSSDCLTSTAAASEP